MAKSFQDTHPALQLLILIGICIGCTLISSSILLVVSVLLGIPFTDFSTAIKENFAFCTLSNIITQVGTFLIPAILFSILFYGNPKKYFSLRFSNSQVQPLFAAIALLLVAIPFISIATEWNQALHLPKGWDSIESFWRKMEDDNNAIIEFLTSNLSTKYLIINIFTIALLPAVCEEFLFRGVLQQTFIRWFKNKHIGIVLCAMVFSFIHFQIFGFFPRMLLGLLLGYIFYYGKSLYIPIAIHFINNAMAVVLIYLSESGKIGFDPDNMSDIGNPALLGTISVLLTAVIFHVFVSKCKKVKPIES